jgi:hypothetical protein
MECRTRADFTVGAARRTERVKTANRRVYAAAAVAVAEGRYYSVVKRRGDTQNKTRQYRWVQL